MGRMFDRKLGRKVGFLGEQEEGRQLKNEPPFRHTHRISNNSGNPSQLPHPHTG